LANQERLVRKAELFDRAEKGRLARQERLVDVELINKNTGISREIVERIKRHVFFEEHLLSEGNNEISCGC